MAAAVAATVWFGGTEGAVAGVAVLEWMPGARRAVERRRGREERRQTVREEGDRSAWAPRVVGRG